MYIKVIHTLHFLAQSPELICGSFKDALHQKEQQPWHAPKGGQLSVVTVESEERELHCCSCSPGQEGFFCRSGRKVMGIEVELFAASNTEQHINVYISRSLIACTFMHYSRIGGHRIIGAPAQRLVRHLSNKDAIHL